jgi:hypothetical protein
MSCGLMMLIQRSQGTWKSPGATVAIQQARTAADAATHVLVKVEHVDAILQRFVKPMMIATKQDNCWFIFV